MTDQKSGIFPTCPECNEGALIPFSFKEDVFEFWKCVKCSHTIRKPGRNQ
jgi:Zn ribbon nucleic-acid-binding protein